MMRTATGKALVAIAAVAAACVLCACSDLPPVSSFDLCDEIPPHASCAKCRAEPPDPSCPQCRTRDCSAGAITRGDSGPPAPTDAAMDGDASAMSDSGSDRSPLDGGSDGGGTTVDSALSDPVDAAGDGDSPVGVDAGVDAAPPGPECTRDGDCAAGFVCSSEDRCVCEDDAPCAAAGLVCDVVSGDCVQCVADADCEGGVCDEGRMRCLQCMEDAHCPSSELPECVDGECGACSDGAACAGRAGSLCDLRPESSTAGACVECLTHADCQNPTPQCDDGVCVPCTSGAACVGRSGTEECNVRQDAATAGQCVQCTGASEAARCGDRSCDQQRGQCTDTVRGTLTACQSCAADSECVPGARCIEQPHDDSVLGPYCFFAWASQFGCAGSEPSIRPYSWTVQLTSVDGRTATHCLPVTSCRAVEDATGNPSQCVANDDCGEPGVDDGRCQALDGDDVENDCTYGCEDSTDCPQSGPTVCGGSGVDRFCRRQ